MSSGEVPYGLGLFIVKVFGWPFSMLWRTRVLGRENVPDGPAIMCCNHVSNLDPILVNMRSPRFIRFMAKQEMFSTRIGEWFWSHVGAFPVKRGAADRTAIATATRVLENGEFLGIFPEGTRRSGELGEAHSGAAFLAIRTGAAVVPTAIAGTEGIMPKGTRLPRFPRVTISFGPPLRPEDFEGGRRERVDALTSAIMGAIAHQLEEASRA